MARIVHELTEIEITCGITLDQVADTLPKALVRNNSVVLPEDTPPALAASVARAALGEKAAYAGHNELNLPVYRREMTPIHPDYESQTLSEQLNTVMRKTGR